MAYLSSLSCDQFFLEFSFISIIVSGSSKGKQKSSEFVTKEKTHHPIWLLQFNQQCTSSSSHPKKNCHCVRPSMTFTTFCSFLDKVTILKAHSRLKLGKKVQLVPLKKYWGGKCFIKSPAKCRTSVSEIIQIPKRLITLKYRSHFLQKILLYTAYIRLATCHSIGETISFLILVIYIDNEMHFF